MKNAELLELSDDERFSLYEQAKRELVGLSPTDYQEAVKRLADDFKI